ncbi:unnamed protein product [Dibothriocephalus latus]|uniref:Uncharacterized protein n=1 Tax=Dibothriocephalus latus TaxID=60516 RepID=A0A3P7L736_DIBLA|nr:unnamed protein product [Dibothriocephalus latus]
MVVINCGALGCCIHLCTLSSFAAALFFSVYEAGKGSALHLGAPAWLSSMIAASLGEIAACVVRVPCEVVKQRAQHRPHLSISSIISKSLKNEGIGGLYRGYLSTIFRELPFSLIQYPVWELLKRGLEKHNRRHGTTPDGRLTAGQFALCGALAGAIAGGCTTPLDVIKTRIMLAEVSSRASL